MSDAPLPPDADDSDNGRSQRTVLRLSDAGAIAAARLGALGQGSEESLNVAPDGQAPDTAPPPSASAGREPDDAPRPPADGDQTPAGADPVAQAQDERSPLPLEVEKADDLQPMLDLRFPDAPDAPPAPVPEAPQAGPDTIAAPAAAEPVPLPAYAVCAAECAAAPSADGE